MLVFSAHSLLLSNCNVILAGCNVEMLADVDSGVPGHHLLFQVAMGIFFVHGYVILVSRTSLKRKEHCFKYNFNIAA